MENDGSGACRGSVKLCSALIAVGDRQFFRREEVMTRHPLSVTTTSSSMRAAE
jgi:hypothetical protein